MVNALDKEEFKIKAHLKKRTTLNVTGLLLNIYIINSLGVSLKLIKIAVFLPISQKKKNFPKNMAYAPHQHA